MTHRPPLTDAQARALMWLPIDGSWVQAPRSISGACASLNLYCRALADCRLGEFGRRGAWVTQYRLTEHGVAARAIAATVRDALRGTEPRA